MNTKNPHLPTHKGAHTKGPNHWIITRDHFADANERMGTNANAPGVRSRKCPIDPDLTGLTADQAAEKIAKLAKAAGMTLRFRLLADGDSDGELELVYEGYMMPFDRHNENADGFEPQDNFGEGNFGTTTLQYWKPGKGGGWAIL
jgi:hypothetical protein